MKRHVCSKLIQFAAGACALAFVNLANASSVTYAGRILKSDGSPVTASSVAFTVQVKAPGGCILYEETQTANLSGTNGAFALSLNGTGTRGANDPGNAFDQIFSNNLTLAGHAGGGCAGSYLPGAADGPTLSVVFDERGRAANGS